jgi:hypothetical protein
VTTGIGAKVIAGSAAIIATTRALGNGTEEMA